MSYIVNMERNGQERLADGEALSFFMYVNSKLRDFEPQGAKFKAACEVIMEALPEGGMLDKKVIKGAVRKIQSGDNGELEGKILRGYKAILPQSSFDGNLLIEADILRNADSDENKELLGTAAKFILDRFSEYVHHKENGLNDAEKADFMRVGTIEILGKSSDYDEFLHEAYVKIFAEISRVCRGRQVPITKELISEAVDNYADPENLHYRAIHKFSVLPPEIEKIKQNLLARFDEIIGKRKDRDTVLARVNAGKGFSGRGLG